MAPVLMDTAPIDQGAILRSGQAAVPNYAEQAIQRAMLAVNQQNAQTASTNATSLSTARQREADRQDAFGQAVQQAGPHPTAEQLAMLAYRFPEFSEALRRGWQTMDEGTRRRDFQASANVTAAARSGNFELAARLMRERVQADRASGQEDPMDAAILTALESPDPRQRQFATDLLERATAAADPERYAQTYGTFQRRTGVIDDILVDLDTGQPIAQSPYPRITPGQDGAFNEQPRDPRIPRLGIDAPNGGASYGAPQGLPQAQGSAEAPAFATGAPMAVEDRRTQYQADNPNTVARESGRAADPLASLPMGNPLDGQMGAGTEVVRVRSRQEADRLPPGTMYMTPDNQIYRR